MSSPPVDVSVIWITGSQKHLLSGALKSIERATRHANRAGISTEILVIKHGSDEKTGTWLQQESTHRTLDVPEGCLGTARNRAVQQTTGKYVAFVDGTDIWSRNFLVEASSCDQRSTRPTVWRPYASVGFADQYDQISQYSLRLIPQPEWFDPLSLLQSNPYPTTLFTRRTILDQVPFPLEDHDRGWTDVDGWWCANVAGVGIDQRPVPETLHYFRTTEMKAHDRAAPPRRLGPTTLELGKRRRAQWFR